MPANQNTSVTQASKHSKASNSRFNHKLKYPDLSKNKTTNLIKLGFFPNNTITLNDQFNV